MSVLVGNPFFLGAGASAGAAYEIERSLRFNSSDSAYLSRQFTSGSTTTSFTFSFWMKRGTVASVNQTIFDSGNGTSFGDLIRFNGETLDLYFVTPDAVYASVPVLRDPSAWYHIVIALGRPGTLLKTWINGVESYSTDATGITSRFGSANTHNIGCRGGSGTRSTFSDIYLADIHFVNGQALDPSSFAETNATTGQWAPKEYTGTYGTNGYHLPFSDNSTNAALGTDTSGNGNTWTVNNITAVSPSLSSPSNNNTPVYQVTIGPTNPTSGAEVWSNAFDADTNTYGLIGPITFTGTKPTWSTSQGVELMAAGNGITASVNGGTQISLTNNAFVTISSGSSGTLNSIWIYSSTGASYIRSVRVDGVDISVQALVGTGAEQDSLVDTPTSYGTDTGAGNEVRGNYCTFNPLNNPTSATLANGNLEVTANTTLFQAVTGTVFASSGKWYAEFLMQTTATDQVVGIAANTFVPDSASNRYIGRTADSYGFYSDGRKIYNNSFSSYGSSWSVGDILQVALDLDNGKVWLGKNGTWQASGDPAAGTNAAFTGISGSYTFACSPYGTGKFFLNAGSRPFAYTAPSGFKALVDTNLPSPSVAKPSTVMDVKLYTGNGSTQSIALGFSPDFLWFKARSDSGQHALYDIIRGASKSLVSNSTASEATEGGGLSTFDAAGFSLSGDNTVQGSTNGSGRSYVVWAWDAGSTTSSNDSGSITSQVRANASAGFSIVTASVPDSASGPTIGHGLGVTPALVIGKNRSSGVIPWYVWSSSLAANNKLILNSTAAAVTDTNTWGSMTSSTLQMGATGTGVSTAWIVAGTQDVVFYCFAPVAGYSAFGSYTGNGTDQFVYLGFRPKLVLIKGTTTTSAFRSWNLADSSRPGYNPQYQNMLWANRSSAEGFRGDGSTTADVAQNIDLLSNGFRLTGGGGEVNNSNEVFVYAAWAESPFQYARAR
jgi:hypothetical protein